MITTLIGNNVKKGQLIEVMKGIFKKKMSLLHIGGQRRHTRTGTCTHVLAAESKKKERKKETKRKEKGERIKREKTKTKQNE